jgi:Tol biopolymer transport system component
MIYVQTDEQSNIRGVGFDAASEKLLGEPAWITSGDRVVVRPELSPDEKRFVMRLPRRTQDDIVVVNRDGTNWRDLTNDKYFDRYPRWSPDGTTVAFVSDRSGNYEIWTVDPETAKLRQLTFDSPPSTSFPIWSPDGKQILFRHGNVTLIIDANKNWNEQTPQALPAPEHNGHFLVWDWSPDGKLLLGSLYRNESGIGYFSFETRRYEKIADFDAQPMWLPDSRRFVFAYEGKAYIGNMVTKKVRELLARSPEQIRSVGISKDGRLLYYSAFSTESDIWLLDLE